MRRDEEGSVLLLTIGYAVLALALVLVCANATTLYVEQKRLDALAASTALAATDGFVLTVDDGQARAQLTDADVRAQAADFVAAVGEGRELVAASTPDGVSVRVEARGRWHPPVFSLFVPAGVELTATGTARNALR